MTIIPDASTIVCDSNHTMNIIDKLISRDNIPITDLNDGQVLFHEGDVCRQIGVVLEGEIVIVSQDASGREIIYNHLYKDGIFGNNLLFSSDPYYKGDVTAVGKCRVAIIDKDVLIYHLQHDSAFLQDYLRIQSDIGKALNFRIRLLLLNNAEERLMYYLNENGGTAAFSSVSSLARQLNLSREAVSRLIHQMERNKTILLDKNRITIISK